MRISELVSTLTEIQTEWGDLKVMVARSHNGHFEARRVELGEVRDPHDPQLLALIEM
ncbi:hypothetical protein [Streptomyces sp. NRRL B-1347]|uniref:hypothetical protein n=1 Tax=Streptomyces sp. NRRL B-1347 TaxID=1476877 RepID=UPI000A5FE3F9|nr:hypothetical protein [Streptomyces sp. NRRL B-1347]